MNDNVGQPTGLGRRVRQDTEDILDVIFGPDVSGIYTYFYGGPTANGFASAGQVEGLGLGTQDLSVQYPDFSFVRPYAEQQPGAYGPASGDYDYGSGFNAGGIGPGLLPFDTSLGGVEELLPFDAHLGADFSAQTPALSHTLQVAPELACIPTPLMQSYGFPVFATSSLSENTLAIPSAEGVQFPSKGSERFVLNGQMPPLSSGGLFTSSAFLPSGDSFASTLPPPSGDLFTSPVSLASGDLLLPLPVPPTSGDLFTSSVSLPREDLFASTVSLSNDLFNSPVSLPNDDLLTSPFSALNSTSNIHIQSPEAGPMGALRAQPHIDSAFTAIKLNKKRRYRCPDCDYTADHSRDCDKHYDSKHSSKFIPCPKDGCSVEIKGTRHDNLRRHVLNEHNEVLPEKPKGPPKGSKRRRPLSHD